MNINDRAKMILYQITNAAVQLTEPEITNALKEIDCSTEELSKFEDAIITYRSNYGSQLMFKKRHPVLLILDEVYYIIIKKVILYSLIISYYSI